MSEWIKCSERLPDEVGAYLVCIRGQSFPSPYFIRYFGEGNFYNAWFGWAHDKKPLKLVTHWMPLPEPPKD